MRKKGALDLSINAIVVLILAITMLGLGLGFMNKMFGGTIKKLDDVSAGLDEQMKTQLKESGKRLALQTSKLELKKSDTKEIIFAIKNNLGTLDTPFRFSGGQIAADGTVTGDSVAQCYQSFEYPDEVGSVTDRITISTPGPVKLKADEIRVLKIQVKTNSNAQSDTYQCSMVIMSPEGNSEEYAREDFEVVVS